MTYLKLLELIVGMVLSGIVACTVAYLLTKPDGK